MAQADWQHCPHLKFAVRMYLMQNLRNQELTKGHLFKRRSSHHYGKKADMLIETVLSSGSASLFGDRKALGVSPCCCLEPVCGCVSPPRPRPGARPCR